MRILSSLFTVLVASETFYPCLAGGGSGVCGSSKVSTLTGAASAAIVLS